VILGAEVLLLLVTVVAGSWLLTGAARRYAVSRALLDVPNHRSSHSSPVPRGGGIAIAIIWLIVIAAAGLAGALNGRLALALVGGGGAVAVVGWRDDRYQVTPVLRAAVHLLAAAWAVLLLGGLPQLRLGYTTLDLGVAGGVLAVLGIVWCVNLYNFMDGIDGLAGGEALTSGSLAAALLFVSGQPGLAFVAGVAAAASTGFLIWNWPPARVFMGDVGSGLLGFLFGTLAVASENVGGVPVLAFVLLFGVFVCDATITLLRRVLRRERWYTPHRSHAYQRAALAGHGHARVTLAILGVNLVLGGVAWAGVVTSELLGPAFVTGLGLLLGLYLWVERMAPMSPAPGPGAQPRRLRGQGREPENVWR
jgi:Fuc2NAc and GlcNAc transferase